MDRVDCVVVGAGVIGLAVARAFARHGREVLVIEAAAGIGTGISARNSEVLHAGIYYPAGSLKARLCVAGRGQLVAYCTARGIAHRLCGKLVVATAAEQVPALHALQAAGQRNGVHDLRLLTRTEARVLEPALECAAALHSPSTGILDTHALMLALQGDAEHAGAQCVFNTTVTGGMILDDGIVLEIGAPDADGTPMQLHATSVINCAGLGAPRLARAMRGLAPACVPREHFAKGNYFALSGPAPFSRLVYPVPEHAGLGVHLTLDLGGQAKFGPDVEWVTPDTEGRLDYVVDPARAVRFEAEVRKYWPTLPAGALHPAYAGVRPKIHGPGEAPPDFRIDGPREHGIAGLVNLFGIESPGLTSALAIADEVVGRV